MELFNSLSEFWQAAAAIGGLTAFWFVLSGKLTDWL